jgi:hypothetical protein
MKLNLVALSVCFAFGLTLQSRASVIANWTFESSVPNTAGPVAAEVGSGFASGSHANAAAVYSNPAGNGSAESFSSDKWAMNDYWQFSVSTIGHTGVKLTWDQTSSNTGPRDFGLFYSWDGVAFTQFANYSVLANASPNPSWNISAESSLYSLSYDLSSIAGLNEAATAYFRLVMVSTTSANGGTVALAGTDRVDNFVVSATPVPEPSTFVAGALLALPFGVHGIRRLRLCRRA